MNEIFRKLNFKDQEDIVVVNAPASFGPAIEEMKSVTTVHTTLGKKAPVTFFLGFVTRQREVDELARAVAPGAADDAIIWLAYPKQSSKKYVCEFNRDNGWDVLGQLGYEGVRMVAIDEDWSALRFRQARYIKTMKRSFARSEVGKRKVSEQKKGKPR